MKKSLFPPPSACFPSSKPPKKKRREREGEKERKVTSMGQNGVTREKKKTVRGLSYPLDCPKSPFSSFPSFLTPLNLHSVLVARAVFSPDGGPSPPTLDLKSE